MTFLISALIDATGCAFYATFASGRQTKPVLYNKCHNMLCLLINKDKLFRKILPTNISACLTNGICKF